MKGVLKSEKGFTLTELIIYIGVLGVVAGVLTGILSTITTTQVEESAKNEVSGQLSFASQTIQRLVRGSSVIDIPSGTATSTLVLRMASTTEDPTTVYLASSTIYVQQGTGSAQALTSSNVTVDFLEFKKFSQYPAKDVVQIDIAISGAQEVTGQKISRSLRSAVSRVSAATFDDNLLPGSDNQYSIGVNSGNRWQSARFSEGIAIGGTSYRDASLPSGGAVIEGNVGIGTTNPSYKLHINGTLFASSTSSLLGNVGVGTSTPSYLFTVATSTEIFTISSTGTIALGGSTPTFRIGNVAEPVNNNDVATKSYVDAAGGGGTATSTLYTSSGTFTVPSGVYQIFVTAWGGGGGGEGGQGWIGTYYSMGAGGGGGEYVFRQPVWVTPGENITVTIGSGGSAGSGGGGNGGNGGDTTFGSYITAHGGGGGIGSYITGGTGGGAYGGAGGTNNTSQTVANGSAGSSIPYAIGGGGGGSGGGYSGSGTTYGGDGGGCGSYSSTGGGGNSGAGGSSCAGAGADGVSFGNTGNSAAANTGGGGSGGSARSGANGYAGGSGGSGGLRVEWSQ